MEKEDFPNFGINKHQKVYKKGTRIPDEDIIEILILHEDNVSPKEIEKRIRHHIDTVKRYIALYEAGENVFHVKRREMESGTHTSPTHVDFLASLVYNYPNCTLQKLTQHYISVFGYISKSMVYYILTIHLKLKVKTIRKLELARSRPEIRQLRLESVNLSFFFRNFPKLTTQQNLQLYQ